MACCLTNYPAAWPKWVDSQYMYTEVDGRQGIIIVFLGPSLVHTQLTHPSGPSFPARVEQETDPWTVDTVVNITATANQPFPLQIRIPSWMVQAQVTTPLRTHPVKGGDVFTHLTKGTGSERLTLVGHAELSVERRCHNAATVSYGPLVFALSFPDNTTVLRRYAWEASDLQLLPLNSSAWAYALQLNDSAPLNHSLTLIQQPLPAMPFDPDSPPLRLEAYGRQVRREEEMPGVAAAPPLSPVTSTAPLQPLHLIPYGSSILRIAEIPTLSIPSTPRPSAAQAE